MLLSVVGFCFLLHTIYFLPPAPPSERPSPIARHPPSPLDPLSIVDCITYGIATTILCDTSSKTESTIAFIHFCTSMSKATMIILTPFITFLLIQSADALTLKPTHQSQVHNRRSVLHQFSVFHTLAAATQPLVSNAVDAQFAEVGQQEVAPNGESPFVKLENGVQRKDFREGSGSSVVGEGSKVELTLKGRLLNLNGVSFEKQAVLMTYFCMHQSADTSFFSHLTMHLHPNSLYAPQ